MRTFTTDSGWNNCESLTKLHFLSTALTHEQYSFLGEMDITFDTGRRVPKARLYACFFVFLGGAERIAFTFLY